MDPDGSSVLACQGRVDPEGDAGLGVARGLGDGDRSTGPVACGRLAGCA
jgi:hypothetical protein